MSAPAAVFRSALRIGQSATASVPSFIASVSRYGQATDPESRWSRPITIGAEIRPSRTASFIASPNLARSPYFSQQMRDGSPWNVTCRRASLIQRTSASFSGNSSSMRSSVTAMSSGSPERAIQRNGPLPSQNSGRM